MRDLSARMRSRGPDGSGYHGNEKFGLAHERLAIMDPEGGKQPIVYEDAVFCAMVNIQLPPAPYLSIFRCISGSTPILLILFALSMPLLYIFHQENIN